MIPPLPETVPDNAFPPEYLAKIWRDLCEELLCETFQGRTHFKPRTHGAGCRGPACRMALREMKRTMRQTEDVSPRFQHLDQIILAWYPTAQIRIKAAREVWLEWIAPAS